MPRTAFNLIQILKEVMSPNDRTEGEQERLGEEGDRAVGSWVGGYNEWERERENSKGKEERDWVLDVTGNKGVQKLPVTQCTMTSIRPSFKASHIFPRSNPYFHLKAHLQPYRQEPLTFTHYPWGRAHYLKAIRNITSSYELQVRFYPKPTIWMKKPKHPNIRHAHHSLESEFS
jgi:hypothetical protein